MMTRTELLAAQAERSCCLAVVGRGWEHARGPLLRCRTLRGLLPRSVTAAAWALPTDQKAKCNPIPSANPSVITLSQTKG